MTTAKDSARRVVDLAKEMLLEAAKRRGANG